eukprot:TRINITY_DN60938_c0_g1_i1.p1 TRINITY_DN60938_c0_g1~~TRINITY_DN60938_c0_g1_i1.p1  ORF type:complete len:651 (-),score=72.14 TRINITY_DN60938_c0_g1_i1:148-2046(-)
MAIRSVLTLAAFSALQAPAEAAITSARYDLSSDSMVATATPTKYQLRMITDSGTFGSSSTLQFVFNQVLFTPSAVISNTPGGCLYKGSETVTGFTCTASGTGDAVTITNAGTGSATAGRQWVWEITADIEPFPTPAGPLTLLSVDLDSGTETWSTGYTRYQTIASPNIEVFSTNLEVNTLPTKLEISWKMPATWDAGNYQPHLKIEANRQVFVVSQTSGATFLPPSGTAVNPGYVTSSAYEVKFDQITVGTTFIRGSSYLVRIEAPLLANLPNSLGVVKIQLASGLGSGLLTSACGSDSDTINHGCTTDADCGCGNKCHNSYCREVCGTDTECEGLAAGLGDAVCTYYDPTLGSLCEYNYPRWTSFDYGGLGFGTIIPTPAPPPSVVSGDPVTWFGNRRAEFKLPMAQLTTMMSMPDLSVAAAPFLGSTGEQWIGRVVVTSQATGNLVLQVDIKRDLVEAAKNLTGTRDPRQFETMNIIIPPCKRGHPPFDSHYTHPEGFTIIVGKWGCKIKQGIPCRESAVILGRHAKVLVASSSALEWYEADAVNALKHAHLDLDIFDMTDAHTFEGLLPELWGLKPMSERSRSMLVPDSDYEVPAPSAAPSQNATVGEELKSVMPDASECVKDKSTSFA